MERQIRRAEANQGKRAEFSCGTPGHALLMAPTNNSFSGNARCEPQNLFKVLEMKLKLKVIIR